MVATQTEERKVTRDVPHAPQKNGVIPPLNSGDRLTRAEFERRYEAHPEIRKAELIEGVVYVASPVYLSHGEPHSWTITWLGVYCAATPGLRMADNNSLQLDPARFWAGDLAGVLQVLQAGLVTPEHADFVESLKAAAS